MVDQLQRQRHRCGHTFASLQAHTAHCSYVDGTIVCVDDPAELGMTLIDGEWDFRKVEPEAKPKATPKPMRKKEGAPLYVRAADRPDSDFERNCEACGKVFMRPRGRGRPPKNCPDCRGA